MVHEIKKSKITKAIVKRIPKEARRIINNEYGDDNDTKVFVSRVKELAAHTREYRGQNRAACHACGDLVHPFPEFKDKEFVVGACDRNVINYWRQKLPKKKPKTKPVVVLRSFTMTPEIRQRWEAFHKNSEDLKDRLTELAKQHDEIKKKAMGLAVEHELASAEFWSKTKVALGVYGNLHINLETNEIEEVELSMEENTGRFNIDCDDGEDDD